MAASDQESELFDQKLRNIEDKTENLVLKELRSHDNKVYKVLAVAAAIFTLLGYLGMKGMVGKLFDDAGRAVIKAKRVEAETLVAEIADIRSTQKHPEISCIVKSDQRNGKQASNLRCPESTIATGGGVRNISNEFTSSTLFQVSMPMYENGVSVGWACDMGVPDSAYECYAVCCSIEEAE